MAKKTKELTLEEKLEQALVPEEEWPYEVPENWCWVRLHSIVEISKEKTEDFKDENLKYVGLENIEKDGGIIGYSNAVDIKSLKSVFQAGQILYGKLRPYLNKHDIAVIDGICSTDILVFSSKDCTINKYINYFFDQQSFIEYAVSNSKGINLPRVSENVILEAACPLPPLSEQRRIVEQIESLFAKLDEARRIAEEIVDSFEMRKSAILHKAFTGELTAQWRKEHGVELESWKEETIEDVFNVFSGKGFKEKEYSKMGVKLLRISNVTYDALVWEDTKYLPKEYLSTESELVLSNGDIVMALNRPITNGRLKISVVDDSEPYILYQRVGCLRRKDLKDNVVYLRFALQTQMFKTQIENSLQGSDQPYINLPPLKRLVIQKCGYQEQKEIVNILELFLEKEHQTKEAAEAVLDQIDIMRKSILTRAFRGKLGTNIETEKNAIDLLKEILQKDI